MRFALQSAAIVAVIAVLTVAAAPSRQEKPDAQTLELCRTGSPDDDTIVSVPIKKLFVDGVTTPVDEILCAAYPREENEPGRGWFRFNPTIPSQADSIGTGFGWGQVTKFAASPDGKYLAVAYSAEGHPTIEVVELPALMRDRQYKPLSVVGSYPGNVSIERWEAGALIINSDMLLHVPLSSRAELFKEEAFSWDVLSGELKPLSDALNNPVRYFEAGLRGPELQNRMAAVWGLGFLDDQSAVPALKQALSVESDVSVRQEIQDQLSRFARTEQLVNACLSSNPESLRTQGIISETIDTLLVNGQMQPSNQTICVIPPEDKLSGQTWYRVDRSSAPFRIALLPGGDDELKRLSTSSNGRFLAAQFANGHDSHVDIVELDSLILRNNYRKVGNTIHGFGGSISIEQWRDGELELTSNVFINHDPVPDKGAGDPANLPLLSPETFVWRSETSSILSLSKGLEDPLRYYCAALVTSKIDKQQIALRGLRLLKDRSALPCLESALSKTEKADIQAVIRQTMQAIVAK